MPPPASRATPCWRSPPTHTLMGYLDRVAARSFDSFRVLLAKPDSERERLRRRLTRLPAGGAIAAGVGGMPVAVLLITISPESTCTLKLATSPPAQVFDGLAIHPVGRVLRPVAAL